eukprot:7386606-Prymnesium_polylepis.1
MPVDLSPVKAREAKTAALPFGFTAPSSFASSAKLTRRWGPSWSATAIFLYKSPCTRSSGVVSNSLCGAKEHAC